MTSLIEDRRTAVLATGALVALVLALSAVTGSVVCAGALCALPVLAALRGQEVLVALTTVAMVALTFVSGALARDTGEAAQMAVLVAVVLAGGAAMWLAAERSRRDRDWERWAFLAEAGSLLSSSIDYESTLSAAAALPVPRLADWCVLDLLEEDGEITRRAVSHAQPELEEIAWRIKSGAGGSPGPADVLAGAPTQLWPEVPESLLAALARDERHLEDFRRLGARSVMILPLRTVERTLGAMTLGSGRRTFDPEDAELAEELAGRCSIAIQNVDLYRRALRGSPGRFARGEGQERTRTPPQAEPS